MYNVANKAASLAAGAALMLTATACGGNEQRDNATSLLDSASALVESGKPDSALTLLDTLDVRYADQIEIRRKAMHVRAAAIERSTITRIEAADFEIARLTLVVDSLRPLFAHIDGSGLIDGYYVDRNIYSPTQMNTTMVQPRIDDSYNLYLVAQSRGKAIGMSTVTFSGNGVAATTAPVSDMRRISVEGSEMMSILPEECGDALTAVSNDPTAFTAATINGANGNISVKITPSMATAIRNSVEYSKALLQFKAASILREKLERQLAIARNHKAETAVDSL